MVAGRVATFLIYVDCDGDGLKGGQPPNVCVESTDPESDNPFSTIQRRARPAHLRRAGADLIYVWRRRQARDLRQTTARDGRPRHRRAATVGLPVKDKKGHTSKELAVRHQD